MANKDVKWQKDLETFFPIYNSFILEGFIDDDQPYTGEDGKTHYCRLDEYFDKVYSENEDLSKRRRVIVYDPTEAEDARFKICDDDFFMEEKQAEREGESAKKVMNYNLFDYPILMY